jgi:hypothetical protein
MKEDTDTWNKLLRPLREGDKFRVKTDEQRWGQSWKGWIGIIKSDPRSFIAIKNKKEFYGMAIYWKRNKGHHWSYFSRDEIEVI